MSNPLEELGGEFSRKKFFEDFFDIRHRRGTSTGTKIYNFPVIINSFPPTLEVPFQINIGGTPASTTKSYAIGGWETINAVEEFIAITNTWSSKSTLTVGRGGLMGTNLGASQVGVVCGGDNNLSTIAATSHFNPVTNSWTTKTSMPVAIAWSAGPQAPSITSSMFILMGWTRPNDFLNSNYQYSVNDEVWTAKASSSSATREAGGFSFQDSLHTMSGTVLTGTNKKHNAYAPSTDSWASKTDSPSNYQMIGVAYDTYGYMINGYNLYIWNNTSEAWATKSNSHLVSRSAGFAAYQNIYFAGGTTDLDGCLEYTPGSEAWQVKANMITERYWLTSFSIETLTNELTFFSINDNTNISAVKKFISLQRRGVEIWAIDTEGKITGENASMPQLMIAADSTEAATLDSLSATSGIINNLNRIRYKIGSLMGYPGSWLSGTIAFSNFVTLAGSQHIYGVKEIGTIYAGVFSDFTGSISINGGDFYLKKGAKLYYNN